MEETLEKENGANYYLSDLHVHTPGDERYSPPGDIELTTEEGKEEFANRFVETALEKGLRVVGITDHNSVDWVDRIREAAEDTELTVFPGFEISARAGKEGIHLVCIFEPNKPKDELDDIITQLGLPRGERRHDDGTYKVSDENLSNTISLVTNKGGLPIAAHMNSDSGILNSMEGELRISAWKNEDLLVGELPNSRYSYGSDTFVGRVLQNDADLYERERPIAIIYSSDSRSLDDLGSRSTHIKLSSFSIEGLKQAFLDWQSRVKHPDRLPENQFSKLLAAEWTGGFLDGLSIRFNENLNCLIGGKGTGKSTVLETIRYAFDKEPETSELKKDHESIIEGVFRPGSEIELLVERHDPDISKYVISRAHNEEPVIYRWDEDRKERGEALRDLSPEDILPGIEIYGQKEILELSRDASVQVNLLKWFISKEERDEFERTEKSIQKQLRRNVDEISQLRDDVSELEGKQEELSRLQERKRQYDEMGLKEKLKTKSNTIREESLFERAEDEILSLQNDLGDFEDDSGELDVLEDVEIDELPHDDLIHLLRDEISEFNKTVDSAIENIKNQIEDSKNNISDLKTDWIDAKAEIEEEIQEKLRELDTEDIDVDDYLSIEKRIAELEPKVEKLDSVNEEIEKSLEERESLLDSLEENRREYFQNLDRAADLISDELDGIIRVKVTYRGNTQDYLEQLSNLKSGARENQLEKLVNHPNFTPRRLVKNIRRGVDDLSEQFDIRESTSRNLIDECTEEDLFDLDSARIPPSITIEFNVGTEDAPQFKPTEELSVGQRCTAVLLMILLHNPYPLLVDQPEDDLDNSFVYSEVVDRLRSEKERRQFVISTHDANIPVLGDAELIQVLKAESGSLVVDKCSSGSIDNSELKTPVENILEGGREAFMKRKEKYGF